MFRVHIWWEFLNFNSQMPGSRPSSASQPRAKPVYGRKQFSNATNNPSVGAPKAMFGSYTQNVGTISSSALAAIKKSWRVAQGQLLWWSCHACGDTDWFIWVHEELLPLTSYSVKSAREVFKLGSVHDILRM